MRRARRRSDANKLPQLRPMHGGCLRARIQRSQHPIRWTREQLKIDLTGSMAVPPRGLADRHETGHPPSTCVTATAERDLANNDQRTQRALRHVVRWLHARVIQKDKPLQRVIEDSGLQGQGFFVFNQARLQPRLLCTQPRFFERLLLLVKLALATLSMEFATAFNKLFDVFLTLVRDGRNRGSASFAGTSGRSNRSLPRFGTRYSLVRLVKRKSSVSPGVPNTRFGRLSVLLIRNSQWTRDSLFVR